MSNINYLIDLGLSEDEASSYLILLKLGGSTASSVAKEIDIKRTTIYAILKSLVKKGFATVYFRKNTRFYYPQKPTKIVSLFKKKIESFNDIIPLLASIEKKQAQSLGLRFIETSDELKQFYNSILDEYKEKTPKEYYIIGNSDAWQEIIPDYFETYRKNRAKMKIKTKLLLSHNSKNAPQDQNLLRECKYFSENYKFKSTIDIFDDKILIISPNLSSLAVVIAVPAMTDVFKSIFQMLWDLY